MVRMQRLVCGYYAWMDDTKKVEEAGSGVLVAPGLALSAKHVSKSFEKLDDRIEAGRKRVTVMESQYQIRKGRSEFATMLYQAPLGDELMRWRVKADWPSYDTDITTLAVVAESDAAKRTEPSLDYFEWQLLPPHWRARVRVYGWPEQDIQIMGDDHVWDVALWVEPARVVEYVYPMQAHSFGEFPAFRLDRRLPHGFSGGPVIYDDRLVGIFSGPDLVSCLWPLAIHKYMTPDEVEHPTSELFDRGTINAVDWDQVKGKVERVPCVEALEGTPIGTRCDRKHVILRSRQQT